MDLRIAVCDDETAVAEHIARSARDWARERGHAASVRIFSSAEELLSAREDGEAFDILLLDIELRGEDGVKLAKRVRKDDKQAQIVFISGYSEYIADGYEVEALNFLVKPVKPAKLNETLDRAAEKLVRNEKTLLLETEDGVVRVPLREIRSLEVLKNRVTVRADEVYEVRGTLGELERGLDGDFARAGRSYVVNLRYIRKITRTDVFLTDGSVVPLSRRFYEPLNRALIALN